MCTDTTSTSYAPHCDYRSGYNNTIKFKIHRLYRKRVPMSAAKRLCWPQPMNQAQYTATVKC